MASFTRVTIKDLSMGMRQWWGRAGIKDKERNDLLPLDPREQSRKPTVTAYQLVPLKGQGLWVKIRDRVQIPAPYPHPPGRPVCLSTSLEGSLRMATSGGGTVHQAVKK
jgi:hypothetical protein